MLRRSLLLGSVVVVGLSAFGCQRAPEFPADGNVILITVDTLRADYLGCYGHPTIKTPVIDGLAAAGIRFSRAYAQSHITLPSHVSILTSLYPKDHGVTHNMPPLQGHPGPIVPTLAQVLKKSNFHTLAVTSNHILGPQHVPGLGRGFDAFHPPSTPERNAAATNSVFFEWLERNNQHRFFAWIHYFDPHLPYQPPGDYASMYYEGDPHDPHFTSMDKVVFPTGWTEPSSWAYRLIAWLEGVRDFRYAVSQYEGEISYLDAMIGEVLAKLAALGLERKTLVVLTADHGESIDEHGIYFGHFTLHEPSTHVPLIFWAPLVFDGPRVVDTLVMSIDIMPTILDILRVDLPPGQLKGRSLLPLLIGRTRDEPHRYVYAVGDHGSQIMVRSAEWKYIETLAPVRVSPKVAMTKGQRELFHVATDPAETVNLYDSEPERAAELEEALTQWWGTDDSAPPARDTAEPTEYLKALGYVE